MKRSLVTSAAVLFVLASVSMPSISYGQTPAATRRDLQKATGQATKQMEGTVRSTADQAELKDAQRHGELVKELQGTRAEIEGQKILAQQALERTEGERKILLAVGFGIVLLIVVGFSLFAFLFMTRQKRRALNKIGANAQKAGHIRPAPRVTPRTPRESESVRQEERLIVSSLPEIKDFVKNNPVLAQTLEQEGRVELPGAIQLARKDTVLDGYQLDCTFALLSSGLCEVRFNDDPTGQWNRWKDRNSYGAMVAETKLKVADSQVP